MEPSPTGPDVFPRKTRGLLARWRATKGWSQEKAAELCGVSRQTWAAWEGRTRPITLQQASIIANVLRLAPEERAQLDAWGAEPLRRPDRTP